MRNSHTFIRDILAVFVLIIVLFVFLYPSLKLPFSLIDDVQFSQKSADTTLNWKNFFTSFPGVYEGRFAPMFWAYFVIRFWIAGFNPTLNHGIHIGLAIVSLTLLYILVLKMTKSRIAAWTTGLWFIILAPGWESWYRISTQEPIQVFFLLLFWLSLTKEKISLWISGALGILLAFSKETSVVLLPIVLAPAFWNLKYRKIGLVMAGIVGGVSAIIIYVVRHASWSAGNANIGFLIPSAIEYGRILNQLYIPHLIVVGSIVLFVFWKNTETEKKVFALQGLGLAIVVVGSLVFWKYPLARLLMTFRLGLAIFLGTVSLVIWENKRYYLVGLAFGLLTIKAGYVNFLEIEYFRSHYVAREIVNGDFLKQIAGLPQGSQVVVNISQNDNNAAEWILMMTEYLRVFYNRNDITVCFIDNCPAFSENTVWASWSVYKLLPEKYFEKKAYESHMVASPVRTSLKNFIFSPGTARVSTPYSWELFERVNFPSESFGPAI